MGIVTENRTAENIKPADPADAMASEAVIQEAGCVWFPNSAYKTAQAIKDFRTEDLPLMILANWRGFSGGQRDMFEEVLKYGSSKTSRGGVLEANGAATVKYRTKDLIVTMH